MAVGDSIGGAGFNQGFGQTISADLGAPPPYSDPYLVQALGGLPTWYQSVGVTAFRGSNTIVSGGWADRRARRRFFRGRPWSEDIGTVRGAIRNNNLLFPRTWTRYASQGMYFEDKYTPVGMAAGAVNAAARKGILGTQLRDVANANGGILFRGGLYSQWSAAERLGRGGRLSSRGLTAGETHLGRYLGRATNAAIDLQNIDLSNPTMRRRAVLATMQGPVGAYAGGYLAGLRDPGAGWALAKGQTPADMLAGETTMWQRGARSSTGALRNIGGFTEAQIAGKISMREGAEAVGRAFIKKGGGKAGAMAAGKLGGALGLRAAGMAVPGLNLALALWTAYDIAKAVIPRAPEFAADVYTSYTGWGNRRMFGGGFKSNEMAITSRQRGVMAIQNSRLNARSVLGAEAGGIHAYFG